MKKHLLVSEASFHAAVKTANGTPETAFNMNSEKAHRRVHMELSPESGILWCQQLDPKTDKLVRWFIPSANIISGTFSDGESF